jgi:hypothetical protein
MDLIAQVIGAVLAFFAGIIGNIFAHDICASADAVCTKIIGTAAARLTAFDRDSTEQEWLSHLHDYETVFEKYRHAVGCFLAAPEMKRCALETFVAEAPGLVWKDRRSAEIRYWEARWAASAKAIEEGYIVKSVKIWAGTSKADMTSEDKAFIVDTTRQLQEEMDRWVNDPAYRMADKTKRAKNQQEVQKLIALGHTREEAISILFPTDQPIDEETPE